MENETNIGSSLLDFDLIEDLGKGNFGSVSLMQSKKDNNIYAIKEIKSSVLAGKKEIRSLKREIQVLKELDHPNIIKYYTSFTENDNVYIVMQYINNGNLKTLMKDEGKDYLDEKKIWDYLIQSLRGLKYLHDKKKIIHRDIKPDNILLDLNNNIKISDFGLSAINIADASSTVKFNGTREGTLQFMAPEVINGKAYDFKSDIYMLGITFFYILSKHFPSKRCNYKNIIVDIVNPNAELPEVYSRILRRFIKKLLEINPDQRPSAENAYCMAVSYYTTLYLKITSIISSLECLLAFKPLKDFFKSDAFKFYSQKNQKKPKISQFIEDAIEISSNNNFKLSDLDEIGFKLRSIFNIVEISYIKSTEMDADYFIKNLLNELHNELKKQDNDSFNKESIISNEISFLYKKNLKCFLCEAVIKSHISQDYIISLFPNKAAKYLNKKEIDIRDLFQYYFSTEIYSIDKYHLCEKCGAIINKFKVNKTFYICPKLLILKIDNEGEKIDYNLSIEESINISDFVEKKEDCKIYKLIGAIFIEKNLDNTEKYVSFSKMSDSDIWKYYDGTSIKNSNSDYLVKHENPKLLFYSK